MKTLVLAVGCLLFSLQGISPGLGIRLDVPAIRQPYNLCLAASVSMVMGYWGTATSVQEIADHVGVYKDGTTGADMKRYVDSLGLRSFLIQPPYADLLAHLEKGRPLVIVLADSKDRRHAMVLIGHDPIAGTLTLNDPAVGRAVTLPSADFLARWQAADRWTMLVVPAS
jgi:ABC-type bacteriocin/lantibiotic exporter with double-glycine peptidase domain